MSGSARARKTPPPVAAPTALVQMFADGTGQVSPELAQVLHRYQELSKGQVHQIVVQSQGSQVPGRPVLSPVFQGYAAVGKGMGLGASGITYDLLRRVRERSVVLQAMHSARHAQLRAFSLRSFGTPGEIGWRVVHRDWRNPRARVPESIQRHIERASRRLSSPARMHGISTMGDVLAPLWDDFATINRPVLEVLRDADGDWSGLRPVDGGRIWDSAAWLSVWAAGAGRQYLDKPGLTDQQMLEIASSRLNVDLTNLARARYMYVESNIVVRTLDADSLIVGSACTRTDVTYGPYTPGYVENCLEVAVAAANALEYNSSFFTSGMTSDVLLLLRDGMGPGRYAQFARALRENTQGVARAHQPAVAEVPNPTQDVHALNVSGRTNKEMQFEVWASMLYALACAIYRMDPSTINVKPWDGGSGPSLNAPNREREISLAKEEGLRTDLRHIVAALLTPAVQEEHPDLEVHLDDGTFDPGRALELESKQLANTRSINEIRTANGDPPIRFYIPPDEWEKASEADRERHWANPFNMPGAAEIALRREQSAAMQQQAAGGGDDGAGGVEGMDDPTQQGGVEEPPDDEQQAELEAAYAREQARRLQDGDEEEDQGAAGRSRARGARGR